MTRKSAAKKKKKGSAKQDNWKPNMLLTNQQFTENEKRNKKHLETRENKVTVIRNLWDTEKGISKRQVCHSDTTHSGKRKTQNNLPYT